MSANRSCTDSAKRNLNPHKWAVAAMWIFGKEYSEQGGGSMDFWESLPASKQRLAKDLVNAINRAPDAL